MGKLDRGMVLCTLLGGALLVAGTASADDLETRCKEVDRKRQAECEMERPKRGEWVLETRAQVATGRKAEVEALADAFCRAARKAGVPARVSHVSELPNAHGNGARMDWRCTPPAVSAPPR